MKIEQLQEIIEKAVDKKMTELQETQKKYTGPDGLVPATEQPKKGETLEPGIRWARCAKLAVISKGDMEKALAIAKGGTGKDVNRLKAMYPDDIILHETLEKALSATTPTDGGFLVPEVLAQEVIPLLYAKTVIFELGARRLDMPNGNLSLPRMAGGAVAYYQGENKPAKPSQQKFENLNLRSKKLLTLVPTSNDLIRNSSVTADAIIRDDMMRQMRLRIDAAALYGAGTEYVPIGVKNTPGISKTDVGALLGADDPGALRGILKSKNIPMISVGWTFNSTVEAILYNLKTTTGAYIYRAEMNTGKLLGFPYITTEQIPVGDDAKGKSDIFFGDWSEFIMGEEITFEVTTSQDAAYDDGQGNLIPAFSNDQTVIKVLSKHDFGLRHPQSFLVNTYWTKA